MPSSILVLLACLTGAAAVQLQSRSSAAARAERVSRDPRWNTIWTFWNYPNGAGPLVMLNLETWRKHEPHMKLVLINETNIQEYVPDLPEEFFRLPYASAKSDFIRASVLYHQGGVYMDTDFMMMKPLTDVLEKLATTDVVGYSDQASLQTGECGSHFSSNFLAARKGNEFSKTWWNNMKRKLSRQCEPGEYGCEKVCCHERNRSAASHQECHIPWAQLEHLKSPEADHDRHAGGPGLDPTKEANKPLIAKGMKHCWDLHIGDRTHADDAPAEDLPFVSTHCYKGNESMTPHLNGQIFWQPWNKKNQSTIALNTSVTAWSEKDYDQGFDCKQIEVSTENPYPGTIACNSGNWGSKKRVFHDFFGRTAYHLFFSTRKPVQLKTREDVLQGDYLVSEMYRRSLGVKQTDA